MTSGTLKDAKFAAKDSKGGITYNAFYPIKNKAEDMAIIDFINVSNDVDVISYKVIDDKPDGKFPSDHYPVAAEIEI